MRFMEIVWKQSTEPVAYPEAIMLMEARVQAVIAGKAPSLLWFLEHPPLYTAGTSAKGADLLEQRFPVYQAGRGGQYTYHGPGQRIIYPIVDLKALFAPEPPDLRVYVQRLEQWLIATLAELGVEAFSCAGRVGVWTYDPLRGESKIAALGIRVKQWVAFHGVALNIAPDLAHYSGIVPCGIQEFGITSLAALGKETNIKVIDTILKKQWETLFCPIKKGG